MAVRQVATIVALLTVMFMREWVLALIAVVIFPAVGVLFRTLGRKLYKIAKRSQEKIGELNIVLQEAFTGNKIVKAFGRSASSRSASTGSTIGSCASPSRTSAWISSPSRSWRSWARWASWARSGTAATG
jgi:ABC-type multidrug transport system fused ATPase/permease subunit